MSPRPDVSQERNQQIVQAAIQVFAREGIHVATMDHIAIEAGISKATIYLYFNSKDELILAILREFYQQAFTSLPQISSSPQTVTERIKSSFKDVSVNMVRIGELVPITFEFISESARNNTIRDLIRQYYQMNESMLAAMIQEGIERGEFKQVDAHHMSIILGATFEGLVLMQAIHPEWVDWESLADQVVDSFLYGISGQ
jgi:AcrR family transcriptional regulator